MKSRRLVSLAFLAVAAAAQAEIKYTVVPKPEDNVLNVTLTIPAHGETTLQMPRWAPGAYILSVPGKAVKDLKATDEKGAPLAVAQADDSTWKVASANGTIQVSYTVPTLYTDEIIHYSGPSTYLYVVGRKQEACRLQIETPSDWRIAIGLDPSGKARGSFTAKTYDVLADNPVTMGHDLEDLYVSAGKVHTISMRNPAKRDVDRAYLVRAAKFVSDMQTDFFGGAPYNRYVWHFAVADRPDGAGGLEHLSSTEISLASGVGPVAVGVMSHEFFHLWNVKRIRSRVLGPFDYTQLPQTGALWWLEGVTDYFAHLLLNRYGWFDGSEMRDQIVKNLTRQRSRAARLEVSPYEASYRVRDAANGRGNSDGYKVSYYDTGFLVGLCLDIELLSQTKGRKSLDDVERALWQECRNDQPGFEEGEIRNQLVRAGGNELGAFYDQIVTKPGELPVEAQLAKVGLQIVKSNDETTSLGFLSLGDTAAKGYVVRNVDQKAAWPNLHAEDVILAINGVSLAESTTTRQTLAMQKAVSRIKPGDSVVLRIRRNGKEEIVLGTAGKRTQEVSKVVDLPNATAEQIRLRNLWLAKRRR